MILYECAVLRYLPDWVAGEHVNVGLLMMERKPDGSAGEVQFRMTRHASRLSDFFTNSFIHEDWTVWKNDFNHSFAQIQKEWSGTPLTSSNRGFSDLRDEFYSANNGAFRWAPSMRGAAVEKFSDVFDREFFRMIEFNVDLREIKKFDDKDFWESEQSRVYTQLAPKIAVNLFRFDTILPIKDSRPRDKFRVVWRNGVINAMDFMSLTVKKEDTMVRKANAMVGRLYGMHKRKLGISCTIVTSPPPAKVDGGPDLMEPYQEAMETMRGAPCIREVIGADKLEDFLATAMAEARPIE